VKYRLEATRVTADADAEMVVPHSLDFTRETTTLQGTGQSLAVSVLDLVATRASEPPGNAIARSVELARHVEQRARVPTRGLSSTRFRGSIRHRHGCCRCCGANRVERQWIQARSSRDHLERCGRQNVAQLC